MKRVEKIIAENRRRIRQTDARAIEAAETGRKDLTFGRNTVRVGVTVELHTRPLGAGLYSGHPAPAHGSGQGEAGDTRGAWSLAASATESAVYTTGGANATRDALDGQAGAVTHVALGSDATPPTRDDTALGSETTRVAAWASRSANQTTVTGAYSFAAHGESVAEAAAFDATGRLLTRATLDLGALTLEQEARVAVTFTVEGEAPGTAVFTAAGNEGVAEALRSEAATVGVAELAFGTGTGAYSSATTALAAEAFRVPAARTPSPAALTTYGVVHAAAPPAQPLDLSEIAVYDADGRLLWVAPFEAFTKTDAFAFSAAVAFAFE